VTTRNDATETGQPSGPGTERSRRILRRLATGTVDDARTGIVDDARTGTVSDADTPQRAQSEDPPPLPPEPTLSQAESALADVQDTAAFVADGGIERIREIADRTDDPETERRGRAVLRRIASLQRVTGFGEQDDATPDQFIFCLPHEKE
jgi:hypothetical protein